MKLFGIEKPVFVLIIKSRVSNKLLPKVISLLPRGFCVDDLGHWFNMQCRIFNERCEVCSSHTSNISVTHCIHDTRFI